MNVVRERGGPDEVEKLVVNTAKADRCKQSLPQDPGQAGKAQAAYLGKKLVGVPFEFTTETGDKVTRASPLGYTAEIVFRDGVTPDGQPYDAVQTNLRMNHLALVDKARGGAQLRIGDGGAPGAPDPGPHHHQKEPTMSDKTILVDGLSVVTNDAGAQAIGKLQAQLKDAQTAQASADHTHQAAIAVKDAEIAKRDAEIDALKGQVLSDAALDQRVQQRGDLIGKAKAIHDADYSGKTDAQVRAIAVAAKLGDAAVAGKHEAYVEARFDHLYDSAKPRDPVSIALGDRAIRRQNVQDNGYAASVAGLDYRTAGHKEA